MYAVLYIITVLIELRQHLLHEGNGILYAAGQSIVNRQHWLDGVNGADNDHGSSVDLCAASLHQRSFLCCPVVCKNRIGGANM